MVEEKRRKKIEHGWGIEIRKKKEKTGVTEEERRKRKPE